MNIFKKNHFKVFLFVFFGFIIFLQGLVLLPPLDRDESRFASASKNMIETKDFIDIELEGVKRYKKPIGIYWAQVSSTLLLGNPPYDEIWTYRIPSLLGVLLSIVLIYLYASKFYDRNIAVLSSFFLIASLLIISEIHQAKSDGLLLFFITFCNLTLLDKLIYERSPNSKSMLLFWISLSLGTLIKGPIILLFVFLPVVFYFLFTKDYLIFTYIKSKLGLLIFLFLVLPWFIIITIKSDGLFWHESLINDLFNKVKSGQESHGFIPGYYFILLFIFFWPGCMFIFAFLKDLFLRIKNKSKFKKSHTFILCWFFVPFILYELIPTKLPHYVLPSYPALSILISMFVCSNKNIKSFFSKQNLTFYLLFPTTIFGIFYFVTLEYSSINYQLFVVYFILLIPLSISVIFFFKRKYNFFYISALFFQIFTYHSLIYYLSPKMEKFWIAKKINEEISKNQNMNIFHYGFNEPSLVFLVSHKAKRLSPQEMSKISASSNNNLFILTSESSSNFLALLEKPNNVNLVKIFEGFNYSQGKYIKIFFYKN